MYRHRISVDKMLLREPNRITSLLKNETAKIVTIEIFTHGRQRPIYPPQSWHGCLCPGDTRSQGISSHGIDPVIQDYSGFSSSRVNTLRPRQNWRHFADDIFKCIFLNENVWIPIKISLKFVTRDPINNIPSLVQMMAWRRPGDKPLSESMMVSLPTHICVTRSQWVNACFQNTDACVKWSLNKMAYQSTQIGPTLPHTYCA